MVHAGSDDESSESCAILPVRASDARDFSPQPTGGQPLSLRLRFGDGDPSSAAVKAPAARSSSALRRWPAQILFSRSACFGSSAISRPRTCSRSMRSLVYSGSQWSGWMESSGEGGVEIAVLLSHAEAKKKQAG